MNDPGTMTGACLAAILSAVRMLRGVFLVAPIVLVSMTENRVDWRGRSYRPGSRATLQPEHAE